MSIIKFVFVLIPHYIPFAFNRSTTTTSAHQLLHTSIKINRFSKTINYIFFHSGNKIHFQLTQNPICKNKFHNINQIKYVQLWAPWTNIKLFMLKWVPLAGKIKECKFQNFGTHADMACQSSTNWNSHWECSNVLVIYCFIIIFL